VEIEWEKIAKSFDSTRHRAWKECIDFIDSVDGVGIDIGCGNGRHLILMEKNGLSFGVDISLNMLKIAKEKVSHAVLVQSNALALPFREKQFDYALFIASLHNIRGRENRIKALKELMRVLKPDGKAIISVWSKWQDKWRTYFLKKAFFQWKELGDIYIPWKKDVYAERFYHLYSMHELRKDVKRAGFKIIKAWSVKKISKKYPDNHFVIVQAKEPFLQPFLKKRWRKNVSVFFGDETPFFIRKGFLG